MAASFYFYDLETTDINPRAGRIMQFAGQRTSLTLEPLGLPDDITIKLTDEILPEPDAIMVTGITPQSTIAEGITEAEFLRYFQENICQPETIFVGFNNVRFDDEFMRFTMYRNFYDAYEWSWQDKRGRWDLLDTLRMTRALRPDGINWPFAPDGRPSNSLALLTSINKLDHKNAHDAVSDVLATIAVARLLLNKQPKLFDYLLSMRNKNKVKELVESGEPFVYTSGKYPSAYEKTTVVASLGGHPGKQGDLVFDLRRNPQEIDKLTAEQMVTEWTGRYEDETKRFPIKTLQFNRCPAVAPLSVLQSDPASIERIKISLDEVKKNFSALKKLPDLRGKILKALEIMDKHRQAAFITDELDVDSQLYDGFFSESDKTAMAVVRAAGKDEIGALDLNFTDQRLGKLFPLYKARNFRAVLSEEDRSAWERFRYHKLMDGGVKSAVTRYFTRIGEIAKRPNLTSDQTFLLEELQLYGESIMPEPTEDDE